MKHSHSHSCRCNHTSVKFCKHCNTVYCEGCSQEWSAKGSWTYTYPNTYQSGYYGYGLSTTVGNYNSTLTTGQLQAVANTIDCKHEA